MRAEGGGCTLVRDGEGRVAPSHGQAGSLAIAAREETVMRRALALIPITLLAAVLGAGPPRPARAEEAPPLAVGYVTKSATNQGWVLINRGARDAADEARVRLIVGGPSAQGALAGQIDAIGRVIAGGAKVVALAPVVSAGVVPIVRRASAAGTPFVTVDTAVDDLLSRD